MPTPDAWDLANLELRMEKERGRQLDEFKRLGVPPTPAPKTDAGMAKRLDFKVFDQAEQELQGEGIRPEFSVQRGPERTIAQGLGELAKESALPGIGATVGAAIGGIPGAVALGMLGEGANQLFGITEPSLTDLAVTGAAEAALPVVGRGIARIPKLAKSMYRGVASKAPGASAAIKQPMITRMRSLPGKFGPERGPKDVYAELAEQGDFLIRPRESRATLARLAKEQGGKDPSMKDTKLLRDMRAIDTTYPVTGKPFSEMQRIVQDLGQDIRVAHAKGGERLHVLTQRRNALLRDMEAAEEQFPLLKEANRVYKQQSSSDEFKSMVEKAVKSIESAPAGKGGKPSVVDFDAKTVMDKLRLITNPRNPENYDKLFTEGLGEKNLKEAMQALEKINDYGPVRIGWSGGSGSLIAQSAVAGLGGTAVGGVLGGPVGAFTGGMLGASAPSIMAEALLHRPARAFLLKSIKSGKGKITNPDKFFAVLGALTAHSPTIAD